MKNYAVTPINWEDSSWKQLSLVGDEEVIRVSHTKVNVLSDSGLRFGKMNQQSTTNSVWEEKFTWFKSSAQYRSGLLKSGNLRKILDHSSKDAMQDSNKPSLIWGIFMSSTLETSIFMRKEYSEHLRSNKNTGKIQQ